jgi:two-component system, chemotaxis family, chemotaxis protein CheY
MALDPKMPVLVVDDSSLTTRIVHEFLQQIGFSDIDHALDGSTALEKMRAKRYGLVISDWNMQPKTGYTLLRRMREDPATNSTPFIMMTTESRDEYVVAANKAGVNHYIIKPFTAQTLRAKIEGIFAAKVSVTSS